MGPSEVHLMGEHALSEAEGGCQVLTEQLLLWVLLDGSKQLAVNFNLVLFPLISDGVSLFLLLKDLALAVADLLGLGAAEISIIEGLRDVDLGDIDLSLGGNAVNLVDSPERTPIDAEWASYK